MPALRGLTITTQKIHQLAMIVCGGSKTNTTEKWCDTVPGDGHRGPKRISLKLKMMGVLHIIGHGATTQMACDQNCGSYAVIMSNFFHEWTA
eukprot:4385063-Pleurochrysis_carterae.AAC.1